MHILEKIVAYKKNEVEKAKKKFSYAKMEAQIKSRDARVSMSQNIKENEWGIIAEFKRKSPSKSNINLQAEVTSVVTQYETKDVAALSVLTDQNFFGARSSDFGDARKITKLPMLRKDFIIDEYQILEAKSMGADSILLISAILTKEKIRSFCQLAHDLGMECLFEIHAIAELDNFVEEIDIIGVNNRNLDTFKTDYRQSIKLYEYLPKNQLKISESGIHSLETMTILKDCGYDGFLIGEWYMTQLKNDRL